MDEAKVKTIEETLVKQLDCLEKAKQDVLSYQARIEFLEEVLVTPDKEKKLCWKDNIPKLSPWKLHKELAKRKLLVPFLFETIAQADNNQLFSSHRVKEQHPERIRLIEIAERENEPVQSFSGVMSDKRERRSKDCKVTGQRETNDEQIEAPNDTGIDAGKFELFGG